MKKRKWAAAVAVMAVFLLDDFSKWNIAGTEEITGRECYIIEGICDFPTGKENVTTFKIWTDSITGIVMKYEGANQDGVVVDYICVTELECR